MRYDEFKAKVFVERPDVKAHYDALAPEYEAARAEIERRKTSEALASNDSEDGCAKDSVAQIRSDEVTP